MIINIYELVGSSVCVCVHAAVKSEIDAGDYVWAVYRLVMLPLTHWQCGLYIVRGCVNYATGTYSTGTKYVRCECVYVVRIMFCMSSIIISSVKSAGMLETHVVSNSLVHVYVCALSRKLDLFGE